MKIIGKSAGGYLCELNENEIANTCGFTMAYGNEWEKFLYSAGARNGKIEIGMTIQIEKLTSWHYDLKRQEEKVVNSAGMLRGLADMITASVPTVILLPPDQEMAKALAAGGVKTDEA